MRTTLATEEIRFGDNDTLPALVSNLVDAELLIILTDQQGLFTAAPSINSDATLISEISINDTRLDSMEGDSRSVLGGAACPPKCAPARAGHPFRRSRGRRRPPPATSLPRPSPTANSALIFHPTSNLWWQENVGWPKNYSMKRFYVS